VLLTPTPSHFAAATGSCRSRDLLRIPLHLNLALPVARDTRAMQSAGPVASIRQMLGEADTQLQDDISRA
jgi:hypothetical protein